MNIRIIESDKPLTDPAVAAVRNRLREGGLVAAGTSPAQNVREVVAETIEGVKSDGDRRVIEDTLKLHGVKLTNQTLRVPAGEIKKASEYCAENDPDFLPLMRRAIANIREYQENILVKKPPSLKRGDRELSVRYTPIEPVAVYVPGGRAVYPSTVLMTVVPAQVAGVRDIVIVSPPTCNKSVNPMILALAGELGIEEIYGVSGAAGLAAVAYGTDSIRPVAKIVGPGHAYITEAKRQLFGRVGIDSIAGPSEVLIVADDTANADWLAADMLAQAEHDPGSAVLVTPSAKLAEAVAAAIDDQIAALDRTEAARAAIDKYSAVIVVPDIDAACEVANDFAAEHLQIITADDNAALAKIRNAGAIFLGPYTPAPLGDYYAGPSHVLPTGGTARFFGPLSCNDFLKASSVIRYDAAALDDDAGDVIDFATREGLTAHARAIEIRSRKQSKKE